MRLVGEILKWLGIGLGCLLVTGAIYQLVGTVLDGKLAPPASDMVSVNGHKIHLICMGEGPRSFVLDAGAAIGAVEWWRLQTRLARAGRVCAFDRAGLGWSEWSNDPHDAGTSAGDLAALVKAVKIPTPFIYIGHSLGANIGLVYREKYPGDVSALVLIEPGRPEDLLEGFHGTRDEAMRQQSDCGFTCYLAGAAGYVGIPRLAAQLLVTGHANLDGRAREEYRAQAARPSNVMAALATLDALPKTAYEDLDVHGFGDTPVLIYVSSEDFKDAPFSDVAEYRKFRVAQHDYFTSLAAMSTRGKGPIIVPNSDHASMVMGEKQSSLLAQQIIVFVSHN
ncbi:MAG TPA: alpha/beta hydrolase [Rhizomicrobium sp.]|jgi:pimeloyl-ACP methyl ester carboxylesterase